MLVNALLFWRNYKLNLGFKLVNAVFTVVLIEIISGVTLAYFDMMAIMQPVHMVVATVLFVLQIALYFQLKKSLIQK
jgi:cytochrome c oxidase assembly protein subunit 15